MTDKKMKRVRTGDMHAYVEAGLQLIPLHVWNAVDSKGRDRGKTPRDGAWQAREYDSQGVLQIADKEGINIGVRLPASSSVSISPRICAGLPQLISSITTT